MTFVCSSDDVTKIVREMKTDWDSADPDFRRIADALPLEVLEAAYVAKLDALPPAGKLPWLARTAREKLLVMRRIYAIWCRSGALTLGELIAASLPDDETKEFGAYANDTLVDYLEKRYPPPK